MNNSVVVVTGGSGGIGQALIKSILRKDILSYLLI